MSPPFVIVLVRRNGDMYGPYPTEFDAMTAQATGTTGAIMFVPYATFQASQREQWKRQEIEAVFKEIADE